MIAVRGSCRRNSPTLATDGSTAVKASRSRYRLSSRRSDTFIVTTVVDSLRSTLLSMERTP
jgi:hypothetical protein